MRKTVMQTMELERFSSVPSQPLTAAELARGYLRRGWPVTPVNGKDAFLKGWPDLEIVGQDVEKYFAAATGVGLKLGRGLVDVDIDGGQLARHFAAMLPDTGCTWGRPGNPGSHRLYRCDFSSIRKFSLPPGAKFQDTSKGTIIEIRGNGQSVLPESLHPSGELYRWDHDGDPAEIDAQVLSRSVARMASAVLLAHYYPDLGSREAFALALSGFLLRAGWQEQHVEDFVEVIAEQAGDDEIEKRIACVRDTASRLEKRLDATGGPVLASLTHPQVPTILENWLEIRKPLRVRENLKEEQTEDLKVSQTLSPPTKGQPDPQSPVTVADLPAAQTISPFDPIWKGQKPWLYLVYARVCALAAAAKSINTPMYEGMNTFFGMVQTLAGEEISESSVKRGLRILEFKGIIGRVPFSWLKEHKDYLLANRHWGPGIMIPNYWVMGRTGVTRKRSSKVIIHNGKRL